MRVKEFSTLLESAEEQIVFSAIMKRISDIETALLNYDDVVSAKGYELAMFYMQKIIKDSEYSDWYFQIFIRNNYKIRKTYNKLLSIRQKLNDRINSGI